MIKERKSFVQGHKATTNKARTCAQSFWFPPKVLPPNLPQVARKILLPLKLSLSCLSLTHAEVTSMHHYTLGAEFLVII